MANKAVLFSEVTAGASWEDEFNHWYDTEHVPPHMQAPGFIHAQRYRNVDSPAYLAAYDLEDKGVFVTPKYKRSKASLDETTRRILADVTDFTRYIGEEIGCWRGSARTTYSRMRPHSSTRHSSLCILHASKSSPLYEADHIPTLLKCSEWLAARRFRIVEAEPQPSTHLALHYLATPEALQAAAREQARRSPWRMRLAQENWFKGHHAMFRSIGIPSVAIR
jgi:hypothetical protein